MRNLKYLIIGLVSIVFVTAGNAQEYEWSEPVSVEEINTIHNETFLYLSTDAQILLWNAEGTICMSRWTGEAWEPREILPEPVNSDYLENAVAITPDNSHIYWVAWRPGGFGMWDIWRCSWNEDNNVFGEAECLGENINSPDIEFGMCFTPDGTRMFFITDTYIKNGQYGWGDMDIWYCDWDSTIGDWGLPYNVGGYGQGSDINTVGREYTPYISRAGSMVGYNLYFSSGSWHHLPGWQGLTDIFSIRWNGQEWTDFVNMGTPINSPVEDWSPCISQDGRTLYFVTRRDRAPNGDMELMVSYWESTSIEDNSHITIPADFKINIYPNPFNTTCKIILNSVAVNENIQVRIIDILGKEVKNLGKFKLHNTRTIIWDGTDNYGSSVTSGVYFAIFESGHQQIIKKMILLK